MFDGPTAAIDLDALAYNLARLRARLGAQTSVMAAVKADAYGHGLVEVSRALAQLGMRWFGVATPEEAMALRRGGVPGDVLLLSPLLHRSAVTELAAADVALTVTDLANLSLIRSADLPGGVKLHLKVDTGMGRLGLPPAQAVEVAREAAGDHRLELEGVWTHLADSDDPDRTRTEQQVDDFETALDLLAKDGNLPPIRHASNSAGIVAYPRAHYDLVRAGICLYGYYPSDHIAQLEPGLKPVMTLTAPVTFVKQVEAGATLSYAGLWYAPARTRVATVRIGYADGYPRSLTGKTWVNFGDEQLPVVGRICMDQLLVDIGDSDVKVGDRVTLWGADGPSAEYLARSLGTVSYELLTGVGTRIRRVYRRNEAASRSGAGLLRNL